MAEKYNTRIDKWIWEVRIFKTRRQATEACVGGKIKIDGKTVKASRTIVKNDVIQVCKGVVKFLYKVKNITEKRIGVKLVQNFLEDLTPEDELIKLKSIQEYPQQNREKGKGRPTKKERRIMENAKNI